MKPAEEKPDSSSPALKYLQFSGVLITLQTFQKTKTFNEKNILPSVYEVFNSFVQKCFDQQIFVLFPCSDKMQH